MVHAHIPEGDVAHEAGPNGADGQAQTACFNVLKQHVLTVILHSDAIILIPNAHIMDPNTPARNIETVCVERTELFQGVAISMRVSPCIDATMSHFKAIYI